MKLPTAQKLFMKCIVAFKLVLFNDIKGHTKIIDRYAKTVADHFSGVNSSLIDYLCMIMIKYYRKVHVIARSYLDRDIWFLILVNHSFNQ